MKTQNLIPKSKADIETAQLLFSRSYAEVRSIIPDLLEWIQDMNWPVAKPVSEYLVSISENITAEILQILKGDDNVWKYWCIHVFGIWSPKKIDPLIEKELRRMVEKPAKGEIDEKVVDVEAEEKDSEDKK